MVVKLTSKINIFWFRRDLRLEDNVGLFHALSENENVLPIFIFDKNILDQSEDKADRRVDFIHQTLTRLQNELVEKGKSLWVNYGTPVEVFEKWVHGFVDCCLVKHIGELIFFSH